VRQIMGFPPMGGREAADARACITPSNRPLFMWRRLTGGVDPQGAIDRGEDRCSVQSQCHSPISRINTSLIRAPALPSPYRVRPARDIAC
jgi:hypothetical protein